MNHQRGKSLYICYFGVREPLVRTQVISYLREIAKDEIEIHLLTFEPDLASFSEEEFRAETESLAAQGIVWHHLAYHKTPSVPATFYDILNGARIVSKLNARYKFDILHARVHVPALMAAIARKLSKHKPRILFDIRGFFPEEYTDAGIWPEGGLLYRSVKRVERWLLKESDGFVVLTEKARSILFPESKEKGVDRLGRPVEVIPCCVDLDRFAGLSGDQRAAVREQIGAAARKVIVYVGSFGGWYLSEEMLDFYATAREGDPSIFALVLTQRDVGQAIDRFHAIGYSDSDFYVASVPPSEIPKYLSAGDAAISFIKNSFSKQASSPTKNAEYLAAGLPIIANAGVGDVDSQLIEDGVGVVVHELSRDGYVEALDRLSSLGDVEERCRGSARRSFDLENIGGRRYRRLYRALLSSAKRS